MQRPLGVIIVLSVVAGGAHADPSAPAPTIQPEPSPPGATAPTAPTAQPPSVPETEASPLAEILLGGAAGAGGLVVGGAIGYGIECAGGCHGDFGGLGGLLLGAGIGLTTATAGGVMYAGHDRDHDTSFAMTWLGTLLGGAAGAFAAGQIHNPAAATVALLASTAIGGTVMFHATRSRRAPAATVRVIPTASSNSVQLSLVVHGF